MAERYDLEGEVAEFLATKFRFYSVKFGYFGSYTVKYRNSSDFLQIGKTLLDNFVRFLIYLL